MNKNRTRNYHFLKISWWVWLLLCCRAFTAPYPLLPTPYLYAAFEESTAGARMRAMGGTFVSFADDTEAVFVQPAGLVNLDRPELALTYGRLFWGLSDKSDISATLASFGMPLSQKLGAGIGYKKISLSSVYGEETLALSGAYQAHRLVSAGLGVRYLRLQYGSDAYTALDPVFAGGYQKSGFDVDLGIFARILPFLDFGYSRLNLLNADLGLSETYALPSQERVGVRYHEDTFSVALENITTGVKSVFAIGTEKLLMKDVLALRFGFGWNGGSISKVTTGFGINCTQCTIHYALDYPLGTVEETSGTHFITFETRFAPPRPLRAQERPAAVPAELPAAQPHKPEEPASAAGAEVRLSSEAVPAAKQEIAPQVAVSSAPARVMSAKEKLLLLPGVSTAPVIVSDLVPASTGYLPAAETIAVSSATALPQAKAAQETEKATVPTDKVPPAPETGAVKEETVAPPAPAPVPEKKTLPAAAPAVRPSLPTHKVTKDDTLPALAERYYGKRSRWTEIYEANKDKIDKGSLKPGQTLVIP